MSSTTAVSPSLEAIYKHNTDLMSRNALAEQMAQQVDPHPTLTFTLSPNLQTDAAVLVVFVTRADLASPTAVAALFPPLLPVAHLFPSPPPFPVAAMEDLLKRPGGCHTLYVVPSAAGAVQQVLLISLGETGGVVTDDNYRDATYTAIVELKSKKVEHAAILLPSQHVAQRLDVITRIAVLSNHYFTKYLTKQQVHTVTAITLLNTSLLPLPPLQQVVQVASTVTEGTVFARELATDRADTITPSYMEHICRLVATTSKLRMTVLGQEELRQQGLYLLASVGQGARDGEKARLIVLEYRGDEANADKVIALCGKGICFDAGGLNLKMTGEIENMHLDMSGSAVVLSTIKTLAALSAKVNVVATLSLAENIIGPNAQKPLTIWPTVRGTVEISNTDCEGRLALVDAFTYVQRHYRVHTLIDCATLTLGVWMICGDIMSATFANDDALYNQLQSAGERVSERLWRFPVWKEHRELLKNVEGYSDWKNYVGKVGESCTAAAFLELFIDPDVKWAHVDFGGMHMTSKVSSHTAVSHSPALCVVLCRCVLTQLVAAWAVCVCAEDEVAAAGRDGLRCAAVL